MAVVVAAVVVTLVVVAAVVLVAMAVLAVMVVQGRIKLRVFLLGQLLASASLVATLKVRLLTLLLLIRYKSLF